MTAFRWAILGTGVVARRFARSLADIDDTEIAVVASQRVENAERFAKQFGAGVAATYDEAVTKSVDACYVATPPALHYEHASLCLNADKATLVEKPFTSSASDARALASLSRRRDVFCMEALWTRFLPAARRAALLVSQGSIGEPRLLTSSFGIAQALDASSGLFNADRGGGALLHRGVYGMSLALQFLGRAEVRAAHLRLGPDGVDHEAYLMMTHTDGALSTGYSSLDVDLPNELSLHGTEGSLWLPPPIFRPSSLVLQATNARRGSGQGRLEGVRDLQAIQALQQRIGPTPRRMLGRLRGRRRVIHEPYRGNGYAYQARHLMQAVAEGRSESDVMPLDDSVQTMELMDIAREMSS